MSDDKEYKRGYSAGYLAGRKSASSDQHKQASYDAIVSGIAKMYLDGCWGTTVDGKHKPFNPEQCYQEAVKHANNIIKNVRIS